MVQNHGQNTSLITLIDKEALIPPICNIRPKTFMMVILSSHLQSFIAPSNKYLNNKKQSIYGSLVSESTYPWVRNARMMQVCSKNNRYTRHHCLDTDSTLYIFYQSLFIHLTLGNPRFSIGLFSAVLRARLIF